MIYQINKAQILEEDVLNGLGGPAFQKQHHPSMLDGLKSYLNPSDKEKASQDANRKAQADAAQQEDQFHKENPTAEDHTTQYPGYE